MSFISPQPCSTQVDEDGQCCPNTFIGFCLDDGTPISITMQAGVQLGWTQLLTGVFTPGPPPVGTSVCAVDQVAVVLSCETHSITVCQSEVPWDVSGSTVALDAGTLAALETITVLQGTSPWIISGSVIADTNFDYPEDSIHVSGNPGAFVLAVRNDAGIALAADGDYIPFTTDNTGALRVNATFGGSISVALDCATDSVTICPGDDPIDVIGTIELGATTLAALETITVLQGTSPWIIGDGGGSITIDGTVTADTNFDYPEDSPHVSADIGAFVLAVRNDAGTPLASNGDYIPFTTDAFGALRVTGEPIFQHEEILCDDGIPFIRKFIQGPSGNVTSVIDFDLEGVPYVVVGTVGLCDRSVAPDSLESTINRLAGVGLLSVAVGAKSVTIIVYAGNPTVTIDADPAVTLVAGMSLTWAVDDKTESLLNAFAFNGTASSDFIVFTTSGPLQVDVLDSTVQRLIGVGSVIIPAGASSATITVISGSPTVTIGAAPVMALSGGMSLSWSVDRDEEDLLDSFTFTGLTGTDFVVTSTRI